MAKVPAVGRVEPNRHDDRAPAGGRVNLLGVLECHCDTSIRHRVESVGVPRTRGAVARLVPAANLDVQLLAVFPSDPVVNRPTGL